MSEVQGASLRPTRNLTFSHLYWNVYKGPNGLFSNHTPTANFGQSDWGPVIIVPLLATIILAASVFLLIIFRQNPTFVITIVAVFILFIMVYLFLSVVETSAVAFQ